MSSKQKVADLPKDNGYLLLASPSYEPEFSLFEIEERSNSKIIEKVPVEICGLIESSKQFPPALAIGRNQVEKQIEQEYRKHPTKKEFLKVYESILGNLLINQRNSNYFVCKTIKTESSYLYKDEFYWIVNYKSFEKQVSWVSRDYFVYQNHIDYFDVEETFLINKFSQ